MRRILRMAVIIAPTLLVADGAGAAEKSVVLSVDNLFCATCPFIVKRTIARVSGVSAVEVSYEKKTAMVTFDDARTDVAAITAATARVGFPSRVAR